jgi:nucleoside-diphosphate-sugar epimerase
MSSGRVAVLGTRGFVGSAVVSALRAAGHRPIAVPAPRLTYDQSVGIEAGVAAAKSVVDELSVCLAGCDAVVNCAGIARATSSGGDELEAANAVLPAVVGQAACKAGVARFVHVSSAVVQGPVAVLDNSDRVDPFSPYATSKINGERAALAHGPKSTTVYRPPSVHGPGRDETRVLARLARSPFACVAAPGNDPTAVAHIDTVAKAIVLLATSPSDPPPVVTHPWEGLTTGSLLELLGGHAPLRLPRGLALSVMRVVRSTAGRQPRFSGYARRVEVLWFGQRQAESWLTGAGLLPAVDAESWRALGAAFRSG